jgi:hypothetical protein
VRSSEELNDEPITIEKDSLDQKRYANYPRKSH